MAFTVAAREAAALAITALGNSISLHTADPGTTGASELTGGSPAYARKPTTWTGGASDGSVPGSAVTFDSPAATATHMGVWNGATFIAGFALASSVTLGGQGQITITPTVSVA